jgi:AraC-like DNA-binding protein
MWKMLFDFKKLATADLQNKNRGLIVWLYFDTILQSFLGVAIFVSALWIEYFNDTILVQMTLVCVEIIASAFFLIARPELLKGLIFETAILSPGLQYADNQGYKEKKGFDDQPKIDPNHQITDEKEKEEGLKAETMTRIEQYIQLNQPFLDPEFSLSDLSNALTLHPRIVSSAIKSTLGMGFPEYTNKVRFIYLEEQLQKKAEMLNFSIDAVAKMVGFSSRSGFYKAFKKYSSFDSPNQMLDFYRNKK